MTPSLTLRCPACRYALVMADMSGWPVVPEMPARAVEASVGALLMTLDAAAKALGVSRSTLYRLIRTEQIKVVRPGRDVRVSRHALERYVSDHEGIG